MIKTIKEDNHQNKKIDYLLYCCALLLLLNILTNLQSSVLTHFVSLTSLHFSDKKYSPKLQKLKDKMCWKPPPRWQWCTHLLGLSHIVNHSQSSKPRIVRNKQTMAICSISALRRAADPISSHLDRVRPYGLSGPNRVAIFASGSLSAFYWAKQIFSESHIFNFVIILMMPEGTGNPNYVDMKPGQVRWLSLFFRLVIKTWRLVILTDTARSVVSCKSPCSLRSRNVRCEIIITKLTDCHTERPSLRFPEISIVRWGTTGKWISECLTFIITFHIWMIYDNW